MTSIHGALALALGLAISFPSDAQAPVAKSEILRGTSITAFTPTQQPSPSTKVEESDTTFKAQWSITGSTGRAPQGVLGVWGFVASAGEWRQGGCPVNLSSSGGVVLPCPPPLRPETKYQSPFQMNLSELNLPWWNSAERTRVEMETHPKAPSVESFPGRPNLLDSDAPQFPRPIW